MNFPFLIFQLVVLVFSVMIHEISHGFVAEKLGDSTARRAGRLTLNPIRHIDFFGSIILPLLLFISGSRFIIGWAKPVPYNPNALYKDFKYGPLKVALAGPASNILVFIVLGLIARFGAGFLSPILVGLFAFIAFMNIYLAVFNLVPIPPLDGSKILTLFLPPRYATMLETFSFSGIIFVFIFIFLFSSVIYYIAIFLFALVTGPEVPLIMTNILSAISS